MGTVLVQSHIPKENYADCFACLGPHRIIGLESYFAELGPLSPLGFRV